MKRNARNSAIGCKNVDNQRRRDLGVEHQIPDQLFPEVERLILGGERYAAKLFNGSAVSTQGKAVVPHRLGS